MSEIHAGGSAGDPSPAGHGVADWLSFAAAPTFATMALLTLLGGAPDMMCSTGQEVSPLGGMVPMYLLMSGFHLGPWLKQVSGRRRRRK
ncbi:hypothetical protein NKG60_08615 [Mesorhizobium sp. M1428]|uniref:hypothetical protein n=1 Tax=unclassified Mesorhizobium TaxID=325217 RepID=UPI00333D6F56